MDRFPQAVFDWQYPQFLASEPRNLDKRDKHLPPAARPAGEVEFREGWRHDEPWGRWAIGRTAGLRIHGVALPCTLAFECCSWPGQADEQVLEIVVDDRVIDTVSIRTPPWQWVRHEARIEGAGTRTVDVKFHCRHAFREPGGDGIPRCLPVRNVGVVGP